MVQIPIYREKKIDSDEWIEGSLLSNAFYKSETKIPCCYIFNTNSVEYDCMGDLGYVFEENEIDITTLAIRFPNSSNTSSEEKRWYNMDEISNIIKEYEDENMATD